MPSYALHISTPFGLQLYRNRSKDEKGTKENLVIAKFLIELI